MPQEIKFTPEKLAELKKIYEQHKDKPDATFEFEGQELLVGYAKYLIQYLESEYNQHHP